MASQQSVSVQVLLATHYTPASGTFCQLVLLTPYLEALWSPGDCPAFAVKCCWVLVKITFGTRLCVYVGFIHD